MPSTPPLTGSHLHTYQVIFQHPLSHNLAWREVHALFRHIAQVSEEPNGNLKVTRNGHVLVLHPAQPKHVAEPDEIMKLRHFLKQSEPPAEAAGAGGEHALLVIDHHEARLFHSEMKGTVPQRIVPYEPEGHFRHAPHSKDFTRGEEKPDPNSFFEPVAKALQTAATVLIFGTGTGMGSEMNQFTNWLKVHRPELARRVIGGITVDEHHLTDDQLLAKARDFHAKVPAAAVGET
jgi:hypothetical protein